MKMVFQCCVFKCNNHSDYINHVSLFRFPKVKIQVGKEKKDILTRRREAWFNAVKKKGMKIDKLDGFRICSKHFSLGVPAHYMDITHPDWVPHLHMGTKDSSSTPEKQREERIFKRYQRTLDREKSIKLQRISEIETQDQLDVPEVIEPQPQLQAHPEIFETQPISLEASSEPSCSALSFGFVSSCQINDVLPHPVVENAWTVRQYTVQKQQNQSSSCCKRECEKCKICVHNYTCTCRDNTLRFNICKHIHAVVTKYPIAVDESSRFELKNVMYDDNIEVPSTSCRNSTDIINEVILKNDIIQGLLKTKNLSPDQGEEVMKLQDKILSILHNQPNEFSCSHLSTARRNENIEKQSYFPTRKDRKKNKDNTLPYASTAAMSLIQNDFQSTNADEFVNILHHEDFDHCYAK